MSQTDAVQLLQTTESGQPRVTLAVETPSSASPFPSPSSTFFPPPIPSSHEFANRIVNNKRYRAKSVGNKDRDKEKPRDQKLSFTTGDVATLSDGTPRLPPSTRSAGASPSNVTNQLPALTPPDSSSATIGSAATPTNSGPYASRSPLRAPSITSPSVSVSQSTPPVVTVVDANSNSLISSVLRDSSVPASATVVPSPVTSDNVQRNMTMYPITRPTDDANTRTHSSPSIVVPLPQAHNPQALSSQSPTPYDSLSKLHAQESSTDTITPTTIQALKPTPSTAPQHSGDEPDVNYDGTTTPVARHRPESTTSLSMALVGAGSLSRASSLSSSRPAPPSPAPSRRASQQILRRNSSLRGSTSSIASATAGSANLGRSTSTRSTTNRRSSTFSMSSLAPPIDTAISGLQVTALSPTVEQPSSAVEEDRPRRPIIVRDFAYAPEEHWFSARPVELLPRSERELKRDSSASRSSRGLGGWASYSSTSKALGAKSGKKKKGGWAALGKFLSKRSSGQPESGSDDPSEGEDDGDEGGYEDGDDAMGGDGASYDDDAGGGELFEEELKPGLYRALYAFEPEGTAEMALVEDQIVRVIARGGGVGWAIVERLHEEGEGIGGFGLEAAGQALVPESYLEPYRLDDDSEHDS